MLKMNLSFIIILFMYISLSFCITCDKISETLNWESITFQNFGCIEENGEVTIL